MAHPAQISAAFEFHRREIGRALIMTDFEDLGRIVPWFRA
jgi:hypothetical protein